MTTSAVEKALVQLIKGALTLEEYGERLVRASVIHTIRAISDMYGLDSGLLEARLVESSVASLCACTAHEGKCKAITYRNKRCTQDAVEDGLCPLHKKQQVGDASRKTKRRKGPEQDVAASVRALLETM
jgi:hypothetical protein